MVYEPRSLAVVLTCHNRKESTLICLEKFYQQDEVPNLVHEVFLVDDGSTDGTRGAVKNKFPGVNIINGDGSLYWTGGMRKGMKIAMQKYFDFYLWLNDDTVLYEYAISSLFHSFEYLKRKRGEDNIVAGSLWDPIREKVSYGGLVRDRKWNPIYFKRLVPNGKVQKCDVINGNVVLLPAAVVQKVGNLSRDFQHAYGDYDYSLRAEEMGIQTWIAPRYLGECPRNLKDGTWEDTSLSLWDSYNKLLSTKGQPLIQRYKFLSKHGNILWPLFYIGGYFKPIIYRVKELFKWS